MNQFDDSRTGSAFSPLKQHWAGLSLVYLWAFSTGPVKKETFAKVLTLLSILSEWGLPVHKGGTDTDNEPSSTAVHQPQ